MQISPMNPWLGMYYAVTGKNARGELINAGQHDHAAARRCASTPPTTAGSSRRKPRSAASSVGKKADLTVLSADYFNPSAVPDEKIKDVHSMFTMVNGTVVWDDLNDQQKKHWNRDWRRANGFHW